MLHTAGLDLDGNPQLVALTAQGWANHTNQANKHGTPIMATLNYEQLSLAALDALLAGGLEIVQAYGDPDSNEWYFRGPMGNVGPFDTPEAAIKAAILTLYRELAEQTAAATTLGEELAVLKIALDLAEHGDGLTPWRRVFANDPAESEDEAV